MKNEQREPVEESCQEEGAGGIFQVIENADKINFEKCPKHPLPCDIMVL
jgi:hypothetical protein